MQFFKYALVALSFGSAIAMPASQPEDRALNVGGATTDLVAVKALVGAVGGIKVNVDAHLLALEKILDGTVTVQVVPTLQATLKSVRTEILSIEAKVGPLLQGTVKPLAHVELDVVLNLLNDVVALVNGIEVTVKDLLHGLPADVRKTVQSDLTYVLVTLNPAIQPVLDLSLGLVGVQTGGVVVEINGLINTLNGLLGGLLNGLLGTVVKIL
ncbi:hypothetical protein DL766_002159 [Monosporascus sp. MC13-8B]|uniref:Uncharacterized protein n=1 Tax=Monosporascus cannonballus TaxID=155416 RepID=A0ABY0HGY4_9PEZI|nr:hypothetical protein DL763_004978 [Monosporascus cannonballus]RYO93220.1 hypothetical protein DL762_001169 [Monosporascus cannonballus]RYP36110.1 hypothetical protein DL766_002159 [Monosporascus sp. MC13-8B]